jgi:hypothetical protein
MVAIISEMQLTYPQASIGVQQCGPRICHTPCRCLIIYLQPCMSLTAMCYQSVPCSIIYKDLEHDHRNTSCTNIQEKGAVTRRTMTSRYDSKINYFDIYVTGNHDEFPIIKPTMCTNFSNLFLKWNSTCFAKFLCPSSGVFHCTHSNGICHTGLQTACEQDQDPSWSCSQAVSKPVWHIPLLCVQ